MSVSTAQKILLFKRNGRRAPHSAFEKKKRKKKRKRERERMRRLVPSSYHLCFLLALSSLIYSAVPIAERRERERGLRLRYGAASQIRARFREQAAERERGKGEETDG